MKLTKNETRLLLEIAFSEFRNGEPVSTDPVWSVCGNRSDSATMGSLVKKGLVYAGDDGDGTYEGFTEAGVGWFKSYRCPVCEDAACETKSERCGQ